MSERYSKLFSLQENLYKVDSPVIIRAGALLKDNINGNVLAQLKFENITSKVIKALTVSVKSLDIKKDPLGEAVIFQYLDLNQGRGTQFGAKVPVSLPNSGTRYFEAGVTEVVFEDLSVWHGSVNSWEPLEEPVKLSGEWDSELQKQFSLDFNHQAVYECRAVKDLWYCTCGAINHRNEEKCCSCGLPSTFLQNTSMEVLKLHRDQRLRQERIAAEEKRRQEEEYLAAERAEEERQHKKKVTITVVTAVCVAAFILFMNFGVPAIKYHSAEKLAEAGSYEEAIAAFEALGDYSNSEEMVLEMWYQMACALIDTGEYEEAIDALEELAEYKDVQDKIDETKYEYILANKNYDDYTTREYLDDLKSKNYKDSKQIYKDFTEWKVDVYMVNDGRDKKNSMTSVSNDGEVFFHFEIMGGPYGGCISPTLELTYPDGFTSKSKMDVRAKTNTRWWCSSNSNDHKHLIPGEIKLTVYDEKNKIIGTRTVEITD